MDGGRNYTDYVKQHKTEEVKWKHALQHQVGQSIAAFPGGFIEILAKHLTILGFFCLFVWFFLAIQTLARCHRARALFHVPSSHLQTVAAVLSSIKTFFCAFIFCLCS